MKELEGKIAFVTGGGTGIGRATSLGLANAGAFVAVSDINKEAATETLKIIEKNGGQGKFYMLDVAIKEDVKNTVKEIISDYGRIDCAVNNAGIGGIPKPMHMIEEQNWNRMISINLSGVFFCMQAEIEAMLELGEGRIVNISSLAGINGVSNGSPYAAAKHGVVGLTKSAALEYGKSNIRVNAVCPGFVETPILKGVPDKLLDFYTNHSVPMKRIGRPNEVADAIVWMLSDRASYVNGHCLHLDGGYSAS